MLQKETQCMLLIPWHWCKWWRRFQKPLKILLLSWYWFYFTKGCLQVQLLADCYFQSCREGKKKSATKIIIKPPKSKVPRDFSSFLSNGENKLRMIEPLIQTTKEKRLHVLNSLRTLHMIFSHEQECVSMKLIGCSLYSQMLSNHKEANTKFNNVTMEALQEKFLI